MTQTQTQPQAQAQTALDSLISSPILSGLISGVPAVAELAAAARKELAAARTDAARAKADAARASAGGTAPEPYEPIRYSAWTPSPITTDPNYQLPAGMLATMRAAMRSALPLLMTGPRGTGKTEAAAIAAAVEGRPLYIVDCGPVRDASEWFGGQTLHGGRVAWQDSELVAALTTPNALILLDEVNRAATEAQNALLPLMDSRRAIRFPQRAERVALADGVSFVLTANIGTSYAGTGALDAALVDRCARVQTEYMPSNNESANLRTRFPKLPEAVADALAELAAVTRTEQWAESTGTDAISTRSLIMAARMYENLRAIGEDETTARALAVRALLTQYPESGTESPRNQLSATATRLRLI